MKSFRCKASLRGSLWFLVAVGSVWVAWQLCGRAYWIDWDTQRYLTQVQVGRVGDGSFSYMHNLLRTWICTIASIAGKVCGRFDALLAARIMTAVFGGGSALLLAWMAWRMSRRVALSVLAWGLWFLMPGNQVLLMSLEDNVWSNFFNVVFLAHLLMLIGGFGDKHPAGWRGCLIATSCGVFLSVGINIHQQLAPLIYYFPIALALGGRYPPAGVIAQSALMVLGFWLASLLQNVLAFGSPAAWESLVRLWHQPYREVFPDLWFFSSGNSLVEWMAKIALGLKSVFLLDGTHQVVPLVIAAVLCLLALGYLLFQDYQRGVLFAGRRWRLLVVLLGAFLVHVPHSLVYEPMNVERWDAILPGLILFGCLVLSFAMTDLTLLWAPSSQRRLSTSLAMLVIVGVVVRGGRALGDMRARQVAYQHDPGVVALRDVVQGLGSLGLGNAEDAFLVADPILKQRDLQVLLTYHYPDLNVVTVDNRLRIQYSTDGLLHRRQFGGASLNGMDWPDGCRLYAMTRPLAWLRAADPALAEHVVEIPTAAPIAP